MKKASVIRRLIAMFICICCLCSTTVFSIPVRAASKISELHVPIVTESGYEFMGRFLKKGGNVYVEINTVLEMNRDVDQYLNEKGNGFVLYHKDASIEYEMDDVVHYNDGIYVPFITTMDRLYLHTIVNEESNHIKVLNGIELNGLVDLLLQIYEVPAYNMRYWKDSKNYETDLRLAEGLRALRNLDWLSFESGESSKDDYEDAFARIILPQEEKDAEFKKETEKVVSFLTSFAKINLGVEADVNRLFKTNENLLGKYKKLAIVIDSIDYSNSKDIWSHQLNTIGYFISIQDAEEGIIRGLEWIIPECKSIDKNMYKAANTVMKEYEKGTPLWEEMSDKIISEGLEFTEDLVLDELPHSYFFELGNFLTDLLCNTGEQLDAVIMASRYLNIQEACMNAFNDLYYDLRGSAGEGRSFTLQAMYDITKVYLRAGLQAQRAMAIESDLKGVTSYAISMIQQEQDRLAEYTEFEILMSTNIAETEDWLEHTKTIENNTLPLPDPFSQEDFSDIPIYVDITWNQDWTESHKIDVLVDGYLDDGSHVVRALTEGEYLSSSDLSHVGSHYIYNNGLTELKFYRSDGVYNITVSWNDEYYWQNQHTPYNVEDFSVVDLVIRIYTPAETLLTIAANEEKAEEEGLEKVTNMEDFYFRGTTGVWYYQLSLDHGKIKPGLVLHESKLSPDNTSTEIEYAPDGQVQSVTIYNALGYKISSEWYDNGTCTAYTYWTYNDKNQLTEIRYANVMDPDEVVIRLVYTGNSVQLYNMLGAVIAEGPSPYDVLQQFDLGYLVTESMGQ